MSYEEELMELSACLTYYSSIAEEELVELTGEGGEQAAYRSTQHQPQ